MNSKRYFEKTISEDEESRIRVRGRKEARYFNKVYMMVTAASKMLEHARFGQPHEVMGLLQGKIIIILGSFHEENGHGVFVISDIISLPVQAS